MRRRRQEAGDGPLVDQRVDPLDVLDGHDGPLDAEHELDLDPVDPVDVLGDAVLDVRAEEVKHF